MFFSFDGIDGVGKSTQLELFAQFLRERGHDVMTCRDPGGTDLGEKIRELLLNDQQLSIDRASEMLLYMASRAQLVRERIRPALDAGKVVVSDRFLLSNVVYQGYAGGLGPEAVWQVGEFATGGLAPTLSFVLDLPVEAAAARLDRQLDRMESEGEDFRRRLRDGFLAEARRDPERIVVIDASGEIEAIAQRIRTAASAALDSA